MNDLSDIEIKIGTSPGFTFYPLLFQNYRVTGVKIAFTPITDNALLIGYTYAGPAMTVTRTNTLAENRWSSWKPLGNVNTGGPTKRITRYYSVMAVGGGDRTIANDDTWTGDTNLVSPYHTQPAERISAYFGVTPIVALPSAVNVPYIVTLTVYVTYWNRRPITN